MIKNVDPNDALDYAEKISYHEFDKDDVYAELLDKYIGVDAPDAKNWYGSGKNPFDSIDTAMEFVKRISSDIVRARYGDLISFRVLWATVTAMHMQKIFDSSRIPTRMIVTIIQLNVLEDQYFIAEKNMLNPTLN